MANRFRNERIEIKLTKEEKEIFKKKMKLANCKTMSHFLRKTRTAVINISPAFSIPSISLPYSAG